MNVTFLCGILIFVGFILQANAGGSNILNGGGDPFSKPAPAKKIPPASPTLNRSPSKTAKKMVRMPIRNTPIDPEIIAINDRLVMEGEKKELTKKQAKWIERFITTINNWLYLIHVILKMDKFKELYREHLQDEFDMWVTGSKDQAFDMIYRNELDLKEPPVHYKIFLYRISVSGIGFADFNLKSMEIGFERSKNKMKTPYGEMVFRKDRVYTLEFEAELPVTDVKIKHEVVNSKEERQFDPSMKEDHQKVKPGYLRLRLSNVKFYIKLQLTEIDKRFLHEDPETEEKYFFERPQIFDFRFSIRDAMIFKPELQQKPDLPEGYVGKGLTEARARIILRDFVDFLVQNKYESELSDRFSIALINKYSKAIMVSPNVLVLPCNLDQATAYYDCDFLTASDLEPDSDDEDEDLMVMGYKIFYMSYSMESFLSACKYFLFKALEFQSYIEDETDESKLSEEELAAKKKKDEEVENKLNDLGKEAQKWMEDQVTKASKGLGISDDGFDWDEDKPTKEKSATDDAAVNNEVEESSNEAEGKPKQPYSSTFHNDLSEIEGKINAIKLPPPSSPPPPSKS